MSKEILFHLKAYAPLLLLFVTLAAGAASTPWVQTFVGVRVPTNANLGCPGDFWKCEFPWGSASGNSCVPFEDPPRGYVDVNPRHAPWPGILHDETRWA